MAEIKTIAIADIHVGERLREIDEDHAAVIAASIREIGLQSPVQVRPTPAQKGGKFTLVAGGHRLRACQIAGLTEIDAFVVKADGRQAQLLEIAENLFRNDLSVIDRSIFVQRYRELWEEEHGEIKRGGDQKSNRHRGGLIEGGFSEHVADRLGLSKRSTERLDQIARRLHPELRSALRHSPIADQTTVLLKLAKMEPALQRRAAIGWRETQDIKAVFRLLSERPVTPVSADEQAFYRLADLWSRSNASVQARFLANFGLVATGAADPQTALREAQA
ncbi:ParB/RepB/Spo0J family partition protein [Pannonibacter sp. SL95]|uniref:ParB/RepB/Spo0J family partition protein n=1 Tax=Pannonibacter sp. SL95 TaxID=2995153 RepID=UPI0022761D64|nr:ParB/RepB/Spo0J family partition protein [Pannonibacter sp. SL95]MCY1705518.1 ParB/RepB/Spo0J family partition protein [Pannonibacter sp. SL95]